MSNEFDGSFTMPEDEWKLNKNSRMMCPKADLWGSSESPSKCSSCRHLRPHTFSPMCTANCGHRGDHVCEYAGEIGT